MGVGRNANARPHVCTSHSGKVGISLDRRETG